METDPQPAARPPEGLPLNAAVCDLCGAPMLGLHCKLRCESCGFIRDCSDP